MTMVELVARAIHGSLGYEWPSPECTQCADAARAVIAALREPTDEMRQAGFRSIGGKANAPLVWDSMIDAALKE